ncbi:mitochondrial ubiquitin ligase activator of nfkb 1-A [Thalassophryne amazonica]|uniref:mitochondrial ubiquitin ligase activator of nfkb 1-A n=1 Tax=Thalassophryne amazonica TaxID=390379 RepID=UPI001470AAE3|nr:mitochondrial ubiquitin ligase activator of nfkb 1-A [Thalassophryne amazonica]
MDKKPCEREQEARDVSRRVESEHRRVESERRRISTSPGNETVVLLSLGLNFRCSSFKQICNGRLPVNPCLVLIGSSFAFTGLFYHLYREKKKEIQQLKEIPHFKPDQGLLKALKASSHKRIPYVAVTGRVQADGEPLASQFIPRCFGVVQKVSTEEHWKYWNSVTKTWNSRTMNRKETKNSVSFSLVHPEATMNGLYVKVHTPLEASGCYLERVHHRVRSAEQDLVNVMLQGLSAEKPVALEESEELLRVGSSLTGFGEVVLEGNKVMRLQPPYNGRHYILVPSDYRSFMDRHEQSASMWKVLTAMSGITGFSILAGVIYGFVGRQDDRTR